MVRLLSVASLLLATACTDSVAMLDETNADGDDFNNNLVREYRELALYEANKMVDWKDAERFAQKGLAAAQGQTVKPERPEDWKTPTEAFDQLKTGQRRLAAILETGVRQGEPATSAKALAQYDCWVEQQEENFQHDHIAACREAFRSALEKLEDTPEVRAARFTMVLFPFDSSRIAPDEMTTLSDLISVGTDMGFSRIEVAGHTDRTGTETYNRSLSLSRAEAVRLALVQKGVPSFMIKVSGHGENQPRVITADEVREPLNRRVEIWLRKPTDDQSNNGASIVASADLP